MNLLAKHEWVHSKDRSVLLSNVLLGGVYVHEGESRFIYLMVY